MTNIERSYYWVLFDKITTVEEIRQYLPNYITIFEFNSVLDLKDYCVANKIELGDFKYATVSLKDLFDVKMYAIYNSDKNEYTFCNNFDSLKYKLYNTVIISTDKFFSSQIPFDIEKYKSQLLEEAT